MHRFAIGAASLLVVGLAWGATPAAEPRSVAPPPGLVPGGPAPDVFLLYTGDVIGYVDPCG